MTYAESHLYRLSSFIVGCVFGVFGYFQPFMLIPSCLLFVIFTVISLEISAKQRKSLESHLDFKLKDFELKLNQRIEDVSFLKDEVNGLRGTISTVKAFR